MDKKKFRKPSVKITQTLSENVRNFRKEKNISQESLADICDLHRTYIGAVERGERNVTLSTLEIIAKSLGVSVPELLTKKVPKYDD